MKQRYRENGTQIDREGNRERQREIDSGERQRGTKREAERKTD